MSRNNKEPGDFGVPSISPLYVQGMNVSDITHLGAADLRSQLADPNERFWATPPRALNSRTDDILILKFPSKKLINYISFERAAFPHRCQVWYLTNEPEWLIGRQRFVRHYKRVLQKNGRTIDLTYRGSVPYIVNRAETRQAEIHPHHYGAGHWLFEEFDLQSVETEAIAITLNRNVGSDQRGPVDPGGTPVDYSLAIRNLDLGYRVRSKEDIPYTNRDPQIITEYESFTQVADLAGSMVELKLRENRAEDLLQNKVWRSEPQPVSYAVVNLYVDARDERGNAQIIDRFYLDPLTSGPHLNLYYSNDVPSGVEFQASNNPLGYPLSMSAGPGTIKADSKGVLFPDNVAYIDLSNKRIQWDPSQPFWIGMDIQPMWSYGSQETHVLFDAGALRMEYAKGKFSVVSGSSRLELDGEFYVNGDVPDPEEPISDDDPRTEEYTGDTEEYEVRDTLSFVFGYNGEEVFFYSRKTGLVMADATVTEAQSPILRFGAPIGDIGLDYLPTGNFRLKSFVLKQERVVWGDLSPEGNPLSSFEDTPLLSPNEDIEERSIDEDLVPDIDIGSKGASTLAVPPQITAYLDDPVAYNRTPAYTHLDDGSTVNALIRMIPEFITPGGESSTNPYGFVGGPGNIYDQVEWTPITRDYKLRQGELQFFPTKAKFFKFEFTNLTPQPYEVYVPVNRTVKMYTTDVEKASSVVRNPSGSETTSPGLKTNADLSSVFVFSDAIRYATRQATGLDVSPVEVLYAKNAREKEKLDSLGSMYTFQPWHPSSQTPRIQDTRRHYYETVEVSHKQRIAYFVGLSRLLMYRVDYRADDDTPEYVETFGDDTFLDAATLHERLIAGYDNFVVNPSFEADSVFTGWTQFVEGTTSNPSVERRSESDGYGNAAYGMHYAHLSSDDTPDENSRVGVYQDLTPEIAPSLFEGGNVVLSFYARGKGRSTVVEASLEYYDDTDTLLDRSDKTLEIGSGDTYWTRFSVLSSVPASTQRVRLRIGTVSSSAQGDQYGADLDLDAVLLHRGESPNRYIDGTSSGASWAGVPHESPSRLADRIEKPWTLRGDRIETPSDAIAPVTLESSVFKSRRRVRGVQFATTQTTAKQLLSDSHLDDHSHTFWEPIGDVITLEHEDVNGSSLSDVVRVQRNPGTQTWRGVELNFRTWGETQGETYGDLEGEEGVASTGGIRYRQYVYTSTRGRMYAAARVYVDRPLDSPLSLQIIDRNNSVLAERTVVPRGRGVTEWWVPYTVGDSPDSENRTWGDIERMDEDPSLPTYGDLEANTWRDLVSKKYQEEREVSVQIVQQGASKDVFYVDNISLFEDPVLWEFSNDGGDTWYPAYGIRNNPRGVLLFPPATNPSQNPETGLRWRVTGFRPGVFVSNLVIRPWYGGLTRGAPARDYGVSNGPNLTPADQFDEAEEDPFFKDFLGPLPPDWYFSFRQLMLHDREYVRVEPVSQQTVFVNPHAAHLDPDDTGSGVGLQDQYTSTYSLIYGNPPSPDAYVNFYDPVNEY